MIWFNRHSKGIKSSQSPATKSGKHKKNLLSTTSSNMMPSLPNNSYSTTATSLLSNDGNIDEYGGNMTGYGRLRQQSTNNIMIDRMDDDDHYETVDDEHNLCLSPSSLAQNMNEPTSYFERAKNKISSIG